MICHQDTKTQRKHTLNVWCNFVNLCFSGGLRSHKKGGVLIVFILVTHFAFAQKGNRVETSEVINTSIPNDSAEIEGEVHLNTETAPATLGKIVIKDTKKEVYTDDKGYFKVRVAKGEHKVVLMSFEGSGKKERDSFVMEVKVAPKSQHRVKLKFYVDIARHK